MSNPTEIWWQHVTTFHHSHSYRSLQRRYKAGGNTLLPKSNYWKLFPPLFPNTTKGLFKKKEPTLSTYLYLILLTVKLKNQGRCKMYPEFNKRSYVFFPLKTPNYKILCKWKSICLFLLVAFQPSLLEACYVKRSHLHLIKVLYQCYGNLTTLNNEGNKKYLQRRAPSEISRTQSNI